MYAPPRVRRVQNTSGTLVKPLGAAYTAKQPAPSPASAARYKLVSATVDTGSNALNTRPRPTRPALPFPLISASTLAALIAAHTASEESVYALTDRSSAAHGRRTDREEDEESVASSALEAVGGEGLPVGTAEAPSYLLLDVREAEAYAASHIAGALSFPSIMLRRDQYPSILLQFVRRPSHSRRSHRCASSDRLTRPLSCPSSAVCVAEERRAARGHRVRPERPASHSSPRRGGCDPPRGPRIRQRPPPRWRPRAPLHQASPPVHGPRRPLNDGRSIHSQKCRRQRPLDAQSHTALIAVTVRM